MIGYQFIVVDLVWYVVVKKSAECQAVIPATAEVGDVYLSTNIWENNYRNILLIIL